MFLVSSCASLRWENVCHVCLWLKCEFSTLCNATILFHTRAHTFCICISRVVNNIESKFHLRPTCGRWEIKPNSYILLTIQIFRTKIYIPNLSQITKGVLKFLPQASTTSWITALQRFQNPLPNFIMFGKGFWTLSKVISRLMLDAKHSNFDKLSVKVFWSKISTYSPFYTDDPLHSPFKLQRINSTSMAGCSH